MTPSHRHRSSTPVSSIQSALTLARSALAIAPSGLFTDVDGTISLIVPVPDEAVVSDEARRALRLLAQRLDTVAVVSGRAASDARRMVGAPGVFYVGNHGLEILRGRSRTVAPEAQPYPPALRECVASLVDTLAGSGIRIETKQVTAAVHYRESADPDAARQRILDAIHSCKECRTLRITEGRMVVNILPPVALHKGTAITRLVRERALRGVIYLGDDVTDLDAFKALAELRLEGVRTVAIAVASDESPQGLIEAADAVIPDVASAIALLAALGSDQVRHVEPGHQ